MANFEQRRQLAVQHRKWEVGGIHLLQNWGHDHSPAPVVHLLYMMQIAGILYLHRDLYNTVVRITVRGC